MAVKILPLMSQGFQRAVVIVAGICVFIAFASPDIATPIFIFKATVVDVLLLDALPVALAMLVALVMLGAVPVIRGCEDRGADIIPLICSRLF